MSTVKQTLPIHHGITYNWPQELQLDCIQIAEDIPGIRSIRIVESLTDNLCYNVHNWLLNLQKLCDYIALTSRICHQHANVRLAATHNNFVRTQEHTLCTTFGGAENIKLTQSSQHGRQSPWALVGYQIVHDID